MLKRLAVLFALASAPAHADLLLNDIGGFGSLGVPTSIAITSQQFTSITDVPIPLIMNGWTADVTFASPLGVNSVASTGCPICVNAAFPTWGSQTLFSSLPSLTVTRPGYTATALPTTVNTTVNFTSFLRNTYPTPTPFIGTNAGNTVVSFVLSDYIFANDTVSTAAFPAGLYTDGTHTSAIGPSVPVANNSTRAYPVPIGQWITEPSIRNDGSTTKCVPSDVAGQCTVEFFAGQSYGSGGTSVAAVNITMGDSTGHTVSHLATLGQSKRLPSTSCTATNGSNVLQNCGSVAWAKVGQRLNVPNIPGQPMIGQIDTSNGGNCSTSPCLELFAPQYATFATNGSLTETLQSGGGVSTASQAITSGSTTTITNSALTAIPSSLIYGATVFDVTASHSIGTINSYSGTTITLNGTATANGSGSTDALQIGIPPGIAFADGGFLGQTITETGGGGLWASATKTIVAPYGTMTTTASSTAITVGTPTQGQWLANMMLYDSNTGSPCIKNDIVSSVTTYLVNLTTLNTAALGVCGADVISGLGIAAAPAMSAAVASIGISTSATTATAGSDTIQFNHNYTGTTGTVTVTAGSPVPAWDVTFTAADFATLTGPSALYFRAQAYPVIGDQILDTRAPLTQGANVLATSPWTTSSTSIQIANCTGINFYDQRGVEVVDLVNSLNVGLATACSGNTLTLATTAANASAGLTDQLAIGVNVDCDWFFVNQGASQGYLGTDANGVPQTCQPTNPAWFGGGSASQNIANAEIVSPNLHHLFGYYDPIISAKTNFAPVYAWINSSGTATLASAIQTSQTDPASNASYFASMATAITAAKSYNNNASNRNNVHNDVNGVVFCFMATGSPWGIAGSTMTETVWTPPPTVTSAVAGGTCPAPGVAGGVQSTQIKESSTAQWIAGNGYGLRVQNLTITNAGANQQVIQGRDTFPSSAFPTEYLILDNDTIKGTSGTGLIIEEIGNMVAINILDNEAIINPNVLQGKLGTLSVLEGSTVACGGYGNQLTASVPYAVMGNDSWDCSFSAVNLAPLTTAAQSQTPWGNAVVIAFNRLMGEARVSNGAAQIQPVAALVASQNILLSNNIIEAINTKQSNAETLEFSGDSFPAPIDNVDETYNSTAGGRVNQNYIEGFGLTPTTTAITSLWANAATSVNVGYSRITSPTVVSSVDSGLNTGTFGNQTVTPTGLTQGLQYKLPCDFSELAFIYATLGTNATITHLADVGNLPTSETLSGTASGASPSGNTLTISAAPIGGLYVGATLATASAVLVDNTTNCSGSACPLQILTCPNAGCLALGSYTLGYTRNGVITNQTPAASSLVSGTSYFAQGTQLNMCQTVDVIGIDALTNNLPIPGNSFPNRNYFKTRWVDRFNNWVDMNLKSDFFGTSMDNGGRIGNWERRFGVETIGDVYQTLTYGGSNYFMPQSQGGDIIPTGTFFTNAGNVYSYMGSVRYAVGDDRSSGGADSSAPTTETYPGLNIGEGDYRPTTSTTLPGTTATITNDAQMAARVPISFAAWPFDIESVPRLNDGTGWSGAYEKIIPSSTACLTFNSDLANDGCQSAPAGLMSDPTAFSEWQQSGQTWTGATSPATNAHPTPYNVPGVDYPVGQTTATGSMNDPATASISGCTYTSFSTSKPVVAGTDALPKAFDPTNVAAGIGYPAMLYCKTSGSDITVSQLNFGTIGGHGGTFLYLSEASDAHTFTVTNNYFENTQQTGEYVAGGGASGNPAWIGSDQVHSNGTNLVFSSNTIIGHAHDACCVYSGTGNQTDPANTGTPPFISHGAGVGGATYLLGFKTTGTFESKYNWIQEYPGQPFLQSNGTSLHHWNYIRDFQISVAQGHGEFANSGQMVSQTIQHNFIIGTQKNGAVWDAAFNMGNSNGSHTTGTTVIDSNTGIINGVGGTSGSSLFPNATATYTGGVYSLGTGGPLFQGGTINAGTAFGGAGVHSFISTTSTFGSPVTTYSMDCGVGLNNVVCPTSLSSAFLVNTPLSASVSGTALPGGLAGALVGTTEILETTGNFASHITANNQVVDIAGITPSNWNVTSPGVTLDAPGTVTAGSLVGTTETLSTTQNFAVGQFVNVAAIAPSNWNISNAVVTAFTPGSPNTVSFVNAGATGSYSSGGTVDGTVYGHNISFVNASASGPYVSGGTIGGVVNTLKQTSGQVSNELAANFVDTGHGTYTNVTITNNYMDLRQLPQGAFQIRSMGDTTCTNPATFSGNINMNTGAGVNTWSTGSGSTGC